MNSICTQNEKKIEGGGGRATTIFQGNHHCHFMYVLTTTMTLNHNLHIHQRFNFDSLKHSNHYNDNNNFHHHSHKTSIDSCLLWFINHFARGRDLQITDEIVLWVDRKHKKVVGRAFHLDEGDLGPTFLKMPILKRLVGQGKLFLTLTCA